MGVGLVVVAARTHTPSPQRIGLCCRGVVVSGGGQKKRVVLVGSPAFIPLNRSETKGSSMLSHRGSVLKEKCIEQAFYPYALREISVSH